MQTIVLTVLIILGGVAQYMLMFSALQDLLRRPRVRGDNKVIWGLVILCVPFVGAFVYNWMGPTSFLQRSPRTTSAVSPLVSTRSAVAARPDFGQLGTPSNVTPIRAARSLRAPRLSANRAASSPIRSRFEGGTPPRRTGS